MRTTYRRRTQRPPKTTPFFQSKTASPATEASSPFFAPKATTATDAPHIQRKADAVSNTSAPPIVAQTLQSSNSKPLDSTTRQFMENRLGQDFSQVKVHTDASAVASAQAIKAKAYTSGQNIVFNAGQYAPETNQGKHLLAHELTHVMQQLSGGKSQIQRKEIEHRALTWGDFEGNSVSGGFDAETFTRIKAPDFNKATPNTAETKTTEVCPVLDAKGDPKLDAKKNPKTDFIREVVLTMNTSALEMKAVMNQGKSAAKPSIKTAGGITKACLAEEGLVKNVEKCQTYFKAQNKAKETGGSFGSDDVGFATKNSECKTIYLTECEKRHKASADTLLEHEQGHFDLTHGFALSGTKELQALAAEIGPTTIRLCGAGNAKKEAQKQMKGTLGTTIKNKIKDIKARFQAIALNMKDPKTKVVETGELWKSQEEYDADSVHGTDATGQAVWKEKIGKMTSP
jgi:hypothetical protein